MRNFKLFFILTIVLIQSCDPRPKAPEKVDLDLYFIPLFNNSEFSFELDSLIQNETKDTLVYSRPTTKTKRIVAIFKYSDFFRTICLILG